MKNGTQLKRGISFYLLSIQRRLMDKSGLHLEKVSFRFVNKRITALKKIKRISNHLQIFFYWSSSSVILYLI